MTESMTESEWLDTIEFHKARMQAFFEEAGYQNVKKLMSGTIADFAELGRRTAERQQEAIKAARDAAVLAHWEAIKHLFAGIRD